MDDGWHLAVFEGGNVSFISDRKGRCSICGGELEYGLGELGDCDCYHFPVTCLNCGATGKEYYDLRFTNVEMRQ